MSKVKIKKYIDNFKTYDLRTSKDLSDDDMFSGLCAKHFCFNNEPMQLKEFNKSSVDGKGDGGIDWYTYKDIDDDENELYCFQSKNWGKTLSAQEIIREFQKFRKCIENFQNNTNLKDYSSKLKKRVRPLVYEEDPKIFWYFFQPESLPLETRERVKKELVKYKKDFTCVLYDGEQIIQQINDNEEIKLHVDYFQLEIEKGQLVPPEEFLPKDVKAIMVNIKSSSLRKLAIKYNHQNKGLYSQNLREYIKNKEVDEPIKETIQKNPENFWVYNNGLIFTCEQFDYDNTNIKLTNFSVINGCQTLNHIADDEAKGDFLVLCKIIECKNDNRKSNIALSSNSQKAISLRDFHSNDRIQMLLQDRLRAHQVEIDGKQQTIFCEIKRGISPDENSYKIVNTNLGKMIWSFYLQEPGKARSGTKAMWNNERKKEEGKFVQPIYQKIFNDAHNKAPALKDLIQLSIYLESYANNLSALVEDDESPTDTIENMDGFMANGHWFVIALIGRLLNFRNNNKPIVNSFLKNFDTDEDQQESLKGLFNYIVKQMTQAAVVKSKLKIANFTKSDTNYEAIVDSFITDLKLDNQTGTLPKLLDKIFKIT